MKTNLQAELPKNSAELIVYQIGEVKNAVTQMSGKFDNYVTNTDRRLFELEKFRAIQEKEDGDEPKIDVQKIILAAFSLITTVVLAALGIQRWIH